MTLLAKLAITIALLTPAIASAQLTADTNRYELILRDSTQEPDLSLDATITIQELNVISAGEGSLQLHGVDTLFRVDRQNLPIHPADGSTHKNVTLHLQIETSFEELLKVLDSDTTRVNTDPTPKNQE